MKKARDFENVLEECLEQLLTGKKTVEQCLERFAEFAAELEPLLTTALSVNREVSALQPSPDFRERARYQFRAALQEQESRRSLPFFAWRRRWVTVVVTILALVLAGGGTVLAARGSMPDDFLYPVKLATERVRVVFTPSALGKAEYYAELAERRISEITRMADENKPELVEQTARRLNGHLTRIADLAATGVTSVVVAAPAAGVAEGEAAFAEAPVVAEKAVEITVAGARVQEEADTGAPAPEAAAAVEEETVIREVPMPQARPAPTEPAEGAPEGEVRPDDRRTALKTLMAQNAREHLARLRAQLEGAPPAVRRALLEAIALSETGYQQALESLD